MTEKKSWSEEDLGDLLAETFRSREDLADPETASTLAAFGSLRRRRRWPAVAAAAAALVVVAGGLAYLAHRGSPDDAEPVAASGSAAGTADNRATAARVSAALLHALPMPPGAVHLDLGRPPTKLIDGRWAEATEPGLARRTWWTVPMTGTGFQTWLRHHPPTGLRSDGGWGASSVTGARVYDRSFFGPDTSAYTRPRLDVEYLPRGDHLDVQITTYVGARHARTVFVPTSTRSVSVRLVTTSTDARQRHTTSARTITDPTEVARLVSRFNALPGTAVETIVHACRPVPLGKAYTLRFIGPGGDYTVTGDQDDCGDQLELRHDGTPIQPLIDADDSFFRTVDAAL